jgi:hypothetical protein
MDADGNIASIYCHSDGYPQEPGVGQTLLDHWNDRSKVIDMIALGNLSSLGHELGEKHPFDLMDEFKHIDDLFKRWAAYESDPRYHWNRYYGRDRGEDGNEPISHTDAGWPDFGQEYLYLWKYEGGWVAMTTYGDKGWMTIPELIEEEEG